MLVKNTLYSELVKKNHAIELLILLISIKTDYNAKIKDIENEIPNISNLATTAALTSPEKKIPNISNLIKKVDYDTKIKDIENKYLIISGYNKFSNEILDNKIKKN